MLEKKSSKIYFISGVSGVGKTSVMIYLKNILPSDSYNVRDLDERGVPDGGGLAWLKNETRHWLEVAKENSTEGKSTIICGFANPELFKEIYNPAEDVPVEFILLYASGKILEDRLRRRHSTPESVKEIERASGLSLEKFISNNIQFSPTLRLIFEKMGGVVIDTDNKTPEDVAREIVDVVTI